MRDYLKESCLNLNIEIVYTDNDFTVISGCVESNKPTIKLSKIFKYCPEEIADAIIGYYTDFENETGYVKLIKDYFEENTISLEFRIEPPSNIFKSQFIKNRMPNKSEEEPQQAKNEEPKRITKPKIKRTPKSKSKKIADEKNDILAKEKDASPLVELDISSITQKDFLGGRSKLLPDETFKPLGDDLLELDIVVGHLNQ